MLFPLQLSVMPKTMNSIIIIKCSALQEINIKNILFLFKSLGLADLQGLITGGVVVLETSSVAVVVVPVICPSDAAVNFVVDSVAVSVVEVVIVVVDNELVAPLC